MTKPHIQIYTTTFCGFCDAAKRLLQSKNIDFEEVDVSDFAAKEALKNKTGWRTVPQIFFDGKLIGGYQELAEMDRRGFLNF